MLLCWHTEAAAADDEIVLIVLIVANDLFFERAVVVPGRSMRLKHDRSTTLQKEAESKQIIPSMGSDSAID